MFPSAGIRELVLYFFLWNAALSWVYAEGVSLFDGIGYTSSRIYWAIVSLLELAVLLTKGGVEEIKQSGRLLIKEVRQKSAPILDNRVLAAGVGIILIPLFVLAVVAPPNNFDSNSYHLHRVLAWLHYGNVDFYPTTHIQQLYHNVFAEYLVLNVYLVSGSDRFVNLVQYFAGLGCISAITLVAGRLGINRAGQIIAAFLLLVLPIGIFEFTTTQVDYIAAYFFVSFLYFGYKLRDGFSWTTLLGMALSLSFGAFTKYPVLFYALPFCVYFGLSYLKTFRLKNSIAVLVTSFICLAVVFQPFWMRNYELFGHVLSPTEDSHFFAEKLQAEAFKTKYTISNLIKNSSLHLGLPYGGYNQVVEGIIKQAHQSIGVDVNQPEISDDLFSVRYSVHEDMVPNTQQFYLLVLCSFLLVFVKGNRELKLFWLLGILGFVTFSTMMKYQLWSTRTHLPFFVMGSVVIAFFLQRTNRLVRGLILFSLFVPALFFVFGNPSKPVVALPYLAKKATGHIPVVLCLTSQDEIRQYQSELSDVYEFNPIPGECSPLKYFPSLAERKKAFDKLDNLGYYTSIRKTVFSMSPEELYFINIKDKYAGFEPLLDKIEGTSPGVGVMSHNGEGYYFYQGALRASKGIEANFNYILFKKEFDVLENTQHDFCYEYILTDNISLVKQHVGDNEIQTIYSEEGPLSLVKLSERKCGYYSY